jgi:hypothetical protein
MNEEPHSDSGANLDPLNWHSLVPKGIGCSTIFSTTSSKSASARYGNQSQIACAPVFVHRYPRRRTDLAVVHQEFMRDILPYSAGNSHPGFMGWVHGGRKSSRHAGGDARCRPQCQSRWTRSRADRGRATDRPVGARAVRISGERPRREGASPQGHSTRAGDTEPEKLRR